MRWRRETMIAPLTKSEIMLAAAAADFWPCCERNHRRQRKNLKARMTTTK
jgi:hypothetical protein